MLIATQSLENELKAWGFETPMHRLTRGVHLDIFRPGEPELFHDLPRPIALFVGRVAIEKNLEAFLGMHWEGSKVVVGDGPDLPELRKKYPDAHFTGKKEGHDLGAHYRSADIFVFPSRTDTFGMVLIEALGAGLPVAAYNVTGRATSSPSRIWAYFMTTISASPPGRRLSFQTCEKTATIMCAKTTPGPPWRSSSWTCWWRWGNRPSEFAAPNRNRI
jgi:hypothetical protein